MHLFKGNVGSGIFALGDAFKNAGLLLAPPLTIFLGVICVHAQHILVRRLPRNASHPFILTIATSGGVMLIISRSRYYWQYYQIKLTIVTHWALDSIKLFFIHFWSSETNLTKLVITSNIFRFLLITFYFNFSSSVSFFNHIVLK